MNEQNYILVDCGPAIDRNEKYIAKLNQLLEDTNSEIITSSEWTDILIVTQDNIKTVQKIINDFRDFISEQEKLDEDDITIKIFDSVPIIIQDDDSVEQPDTTQESEKPEPVVELTPVSINIERKFLANIEKYIEKNISRMCYENLEDYVMHLIRRDFDRHNVYTSL